MPDDLLPVFFATTQSDEAAAERILDATGLKYSARIEVIEKRRAEGVCYQGLLYEVPADAAEKCRQLFIQNGLQRGVIEPGEIPEKRVIHPSGHS
jgi:hypothetical protein